MLAFEEEAEDCRRKALEYRLARQRSDLLRPINE